MMTAKPPFDSLSLALVMVLGMFLAILATNLMRMSNGHFPQ